MAKIVDNPVVHLPTSDQAPMSERLFELISNAIIEGEYPPGSTMTEPELAKRYGVSRAPLREALRRLEERQLLQRSPYRGMRVVEPSARMIRELYEIREALEALACRRAAAVISNDEVARVRSALVEERRSILSRSSHPADQDGRSRFLGFHSMIAEISGNRELLQLLNREIWRLLRADYRRRIHRPEALRKGHLQHLQILRALRERDAELAVLLMRRHIVSTRRLREEALGETASQVAVPGGAADLKPAG